MQTIEPNVFISINTIADNKVKMRSQVYIQMLIIWPPYDNKRIHNCREVIM